MDNLTKGEKKILLQFKRVTETQPFKEEVKRVRKALKIPLNGMPLPKGELGDIGNYIKRPEHEESQYKAVGFYWEQVGKYPKEVKRLLSMFPVLNYYFELLLRNYIYYNIFLYAELEEYSNLSSNICVIVGAEEEVENYSINDDPERVFSVNAHNKKINESVYKYPVSIRIHSDASQNDIVAYVKKNWKAIKGYQDKYRNNDALFSLKNSRTKIDKKLKERDDFIYEHKDLPRKVIMELLYRKNDKDFEIDYGYIGKIISTEKKRRKEM